MRGGKKSAVLVNRILDGQLQAEAIHVTSAGLQRAILPLLCYRSGYER